MAKLSAKDIGDIAIFPTMLFLSLHRSRLNMNFVNELDQLHLMCGKNLFLLLQTNTAFRKLSALARPKSAF